MPNLPSALPVCQIQATALRRKGGPLQIETLELEGPRDDGVLVRLVASDICRTEIDFCDQWYDGSEGSEALVLGHEGEGVVERVGRSVRGFEVGDHVVLSYQSCGLCLSFRSGRPAALHPETDRALPGRPVPLRPFGEVFPFGDINRAVADARRGESIKPVLRISEA